MLRARLSLVVCGLAAVGTSSCKRSLRRILPQPHAEITVNTVAGAGKVQAALRAGEDENEDGDPAADAGPTGTYDIRFALVPDPAAGAAPAGLDISELAISGNEVVATTDRG